MGRTEINDYIIYKIVCLSNNDLVYVGSTANFYVRRRHHKSNCTNTLSENYYQKKYIAIRENGGWENWNMLIIDELKQITLIESKQIEEAWRIKLQANLNGMKCYRTKQEGKDYYKNHIKEWCIKNKEIYTKNNNARSKEFYSNNKELLQINVTCECGSIVKKFSLNKHKQSQKHNKFIEELVTKNKEKIPEYNIKYNEYYIKNKEKIAAQQKEYREKNKEKFTCDCGCIVNKYGLLKHKQTPKHIELMEELVTKNKEL